MEDRDRHAWAPRLLVFWIGAASLGGQVGWFRLVGAVVGGTFAAAALTLAGAMAGLAIGAMLAGKALQRRPARPLLAGVLLACAAALAMMPWLVLAIGRAEGTPVLRRLLAAALLGLAHLPFGAVLPLAVAWRGVARDRLASGGGGLYALLALGAVAGALGAGMLLSGLMAIDHIGLLLGGATLLAALLLLAPAPAAARDVLEPGQATPLPGNLALVAFGTGLLGLAAESLWMRVLGFYWEGNTLTYSIVTASYVGGLWIGSLVASRLAMRRPPQAAGIAAALGLSAGGLAGAAALAPVAVSAFHPVERLAAALGLVGLPAALFGGAFVFLMGGVRGEGSGGRALGLLAGINNAGSAAGPLLMWAAAPVIAWPQKPLFLLSCGYVLLIPAILGWRSLRGAAAFGLAAALGLLGVILVPAGPGAGPYRPGGAPDEAPDLYATVLPFVRSGLESTVAVTRETRLGTEVLWIDRGFQGDTGALGRRIPIVLGRLPCDLLGRPAGRALVIGLGTGVTLSGVVERGARSIEVAELCEGVIEADRTLLAEANGRALDRPEVRVLHADGRPMLLDAAAPYDLIVVDMIFPHIPGAGNLFSREFYALARRRLAADGVFMHWLPCSQLSSEDLSATVAAFLEAFPEGTAWIGFFAPRRFILGLAGGAASPATGGTRRALGPAELRALAGGSAPLRDADPRLEYRSNRTRDDAAFGVANLRRVMERLETAEPARRAWLLFAEAGLAEVRAEDLPADSAERRALQDQSEALYRQAAAAAPGVTDAEFFLESIAYQDHLELAQEAAGRGDEDRALAELGVAASYPHHGGGHFILADALASRGDVKAAMAELEKGLGKSPRSADAQVKLALVALEAGDREKALRSWQRACALRPDLPPLYRDLGARLGLKN